MTINLEVKKRENKVGGEDVLFGVVYGPKQEPLSVSVSKKKFQDVFKEAGESSVVTLEGLDDAIEVLIHKVDFDPVRGGIKHVDFYAIERGKELTTNVSLNFVGVAPAVEKGGVLNKVLHELEITCRPSVLPREIEVDLSTLIEIDDSLKVSDITVPEGVKVENDENDVVAIVSAMVEEKEEEVSGEVDMDSIEVEAKGKEEAKEEKAE